MLALQWVEDHLKRKVRVRVMDEVNESFTNFTHIRVVGVL